MVVCRLPEVVAEARVQSPSSSVKSTPEDEKPEVQSRSEEVGGQIRGLEQSRCVIRYTATNAAFVGVLSDFDRYTSATYPLHEPLHFGSRTGREGTQLIGE